MTPNRLPMGEDDSGKRIQRMIPVYRTALIEAGTDRDMLVGISIQDSVCFAAAYLATRDVGAVPAILGLAPDVERQLGAIGAEILCNANQSQSLEVQRRNQPRSSRFPIETRVMSRTSGSTGEPKYVLWSQAGIDYQTRMTCNYLEYGHGDCILVAMRPWSAYGLSLIHMWTALDCAIVFPNELGPAHLVTLIERYQITAVESFPAIYQFLLDWLLRHRNGLPAIRSVRFWGCGGDTLPSKLALDWIDLISQPIMDGYGLAEAGPNVALNSPGNWRLGTVGRPLPGTEVRIAESGELLVHSPSTLVGYWPGPVSKSPTLSDGYWLRTGDRATMDNSGYVTLHGRMIDSLCVDGATVYPGETEQVLRQIPGVAQCAVIGLKNGSRGHRLVAFLASTGGTLDVREIRRFAERRLEPKSLPHQYHVIRDLPRTPTGKVDRIALGELAGNWPNQS